jgi:hypothetical protein
MLSREILHLITFNAPATLARSRPPRTKQWVSTKQHFAGPALSVISFEHVLATWPWGIDAAPDGLGLGFGFPLRLLG